ncbi:2-oxoacid:ferredoxin oxidoreductase subunit beta [Candidatus Shapirobacteria bacterium]|nr:2-oxoacid:ferredoxin oxidoreductase subunit beta [Candidatus Shapirobacteria bacterium]
MNINNYSTNQLPTWCPGCGNFGVLQSLKQALVELKIAPKDAVVTYDIGCGGNMVNLLRVCGFATLHGRSVPVAVGAKLANPGLTVIAQAGDGGLLNEGANHLIHAAQRNDNITVLLHNNLVFALTAGQASSATPAGLATKSTPQGNPYPPLQPLLLTAAASPKAFLSRAFAFDLPQATAIIEAAIKHQGFSLVEIIMPCLVWSDDYNQEYFRKRIYYPQNTPKNYSSLLEFLGENNDKIPLGIFWSPRK